MRKRHVGASPETGARRIAEVVDGAWGSRFGGGEVGVPVSAVAALSLVEPVGSSSVSDLREQVLAWDAAGCGRSLRRIWIRFARVRPDLIPVVRPLCGWLWSDTADGHLDEVQTVMAAAVRAGLLEFVAGPAVEQVDLLGLVLEALRGDKAMAARGAFYTPSDVARTLARLLGIEADGRVYEECAGTGGMLLAAAVSMREQGLDPARTMWVANDVDPIAAGCCAVNTHLWGLPQVLIGCGDVLVGDWLATARRERAQAITKAATTPASVLLGGGA